MTGSDVLYGDGVEADRHRLSRLWKTVAGRPPVAVADGRELLEHLAQCGRGEREWPRLVLVALDLPGISGLEILAESKRSDGLRALPVVILGPSAADDAVDECFRLHANGYVCKEPGEDELITMLRNIHDFWFAPGTIVRMG